MADSYVITNTTPRTRSAPGGQFTKVQEVTFQALPSKQYGQVDIPLDDFTPDNVAAVVAPLAANLNAVKNL